MARRPPLVIVSGAPGSGKSTLAALLSRRLGLPFIARDELKERLADTLFPVGAEAQLGAGGIDSAALGRAAYTMLFTVADRFVDAGAGVILESNVRRGVAEPELAPRVARASAVLVNCQAPATLIVDRFLARAGSADRHRVHPDLDRLDDLELDLAAGRFEPLDLGVETIRVDTSEGYEPSLDDVVGRLRRLVDSRG